MNEKKQTIIYVVISIGLLLAAVVGATFAYFRAQVGEGANINITSTSGTTDSLTFRTEGGPINIEANQENFGQVGGKSQQASAKAIANLIASDAKDATYTYNVYLQIDENELTYTKDDNTPELVISIKNPEGTYLTELNGFEKITQVTIDGDETQEDPVTGFDITKYTGLIPIAENETITAQKGQTETKTWEVYVTLIYLKEDNQNDNTGKQVKGTLIIQKDKMASTATGESKVEANIQLLSDKAGSMTETKKGEFLQHTAKDPTSAGDNGYRYSGNNPDNFICFGPGSEDYNNGTSEATCPLKNKYRIIGIVPVTKEDGSQEQLVKVIKSEYITKEELGKTANDGTVSSNPSYTDKKRVEADVTNLDGFYWNESSNTWTDGNYNYWSKQEDGEETPKVATLNESLNNDKTGYLSKLKKEDGGTYWIDKIETVQWNVGGVSSSKVTSKAMKEAEESDQLGGSITSTDKIGLMYASDYGFASAKENWGTSVYSYNNDNNRNANWLFNGVYEWTISRDSSNSNSAFHVYRTGYVGNYSVISSDGVRPVFYLKSNVGIKSDGATGSSEHPFGIQ